MASNSNTRISPANITMVLGLAAIWIISFLGGFITSPNGKPAFAIIFATVLTAFLFGMLAIALKAKKTDNNPEKWRWIGWGAILIYIIAAYGGRVPFLDFFTVLSHKQELKEAAEAEITSIEELHRDYNYKAEQAINTAGENFTNYIDAQIPSSSMILYMQKNGIDDRDMVQSWMENAKALALVPEQNQNLQEVKSIVRSWNLLQLSKAASQLKELEESEWNGLEMRISENKSEHELIPVISGDFTGYEINGYADIEILPRPNAEFYNTLTNTHEAPTGGVILYVLCNLLILLSYFATRSTAMVGQRKNANTGGSTINI